MSLIGSDILDTWSPVGGSVWGGLHGTVLLERQSHWGQAMRVKTQYQTDHQEEKHEQQHREATMMAVDSRNCLTTGASTSVLLTPGEKPSEPWACRYPEEQSPLPTPEGAINGATTPKLHQLEGKFTPPRNTGFSCSD